MSHYWFVIATYVEWLFMQPSIKNINIKYIENAVTFKNQIENQNKYYVSRWRSSTRTPVILCNCSILLMQTISFPSSDTQSGIGVPQ